MTRLKIQYIFVYTIVVYKFARCKSNEIKAVILEMDPN